MKAIIFVDFWNFQITLQNKYKRDNQHSESDQFEIDWFNLGPKITTLASLHALPQGEGLTLDYQEMRIYSSANRDDDKQKNYLNQVLGRQPGIRVFCLERATRTTSPCDQCGATREINQEKGVDTLLVTDILRLGLDKTYDVAILISQDADMKPAIEHLADKGIKVIHVGINNVGANIASSCWSDFDIYPLRDSIKK